ncbi:MAG: hypothetical protein AB8G99_24670 [Planctomycetaceae bacterium]
MNRETLIQRAVASELPQKQPVRSLIRDLAAWHSDQFARENGVGRLSRSRMRQQVRVRTQNDYDVFKKDRAAIQSRVLPETYELNHVVTGSLSSFLLPILIRWIVSSVTNFLIRLYLDRSRLDEVLGR